MGDRSKYPGAMLSACALWVVSACALACGCVDDGAEEPEDGSSDAFLDESGKADARYTPCELREVLTFVNAPSTDLATLRAARVPMRAAQQLVAARAGRDRRLGTPDDVLFADLRAVDAVPQVGPIAFERLVAAVRSRCAGGACGNGALRGASWLELPPLAHAPAAVLVLGNRVLLGTVDDGLYAAPVDGSAAFARVALPGRFVSALAALDDTGMNAVLGLGPDTEAAVGVDALPLWLTTDGGRSWAPVGTELLDEGSSTQEHRIYSSIQHLTVAPRTSRSPAAIFANTLGGSIARSTDHGHTWQFVVGMPGTFGYGCYSIVPLDAPDTLVQGCELPLDSAWVRGYDLTARGIEESGALWVDQEVIGNRRPNTLAAFANAPGVVYAGLEGGLVRIARESPHTLTWLFRATEDRTRDAYTYVRFVWLDPCDARHLVFGGLSQDDPPTLQLYESFDDGATHPLVAAPRGWSAESIRVASGHVFGADGRSYALAVELKNGDRSETRVVIRRHMPR